jgi:hypothetical protein
MSALTINRTQTTGVPPTVPPDQQRGDITIANAISPLTMNEFKSWTELILF